MDWAPARLFLLGIGGAVILGSAIATAYHVGGAEPLLTAPPAPEGGPDSPGPGAESQAAASSGTEDPPLIPDAPPAPAGPLRRTPDPAVPSGASGGANPGAGDEGPLVGADGARDDDPPNGSEESPFLPPPPDVPTDPLPDGDGPLDDVDEVEPDDATDPADDAGANVPSPGTVLPGITLSPAADRILFGR